MLKQVSKFNDGVQALIFNPNAMAPTFPESAITKPFPFNAYYDLDDAPEVDGKTWKLEVRGLVENKKPGRWKSSTSCRRSSRSPATSASRAGARSEAGPARRCAISSK
jgi:DMSO/TMAO reductase YedYZ molybdopterin-dependent catalytic subunit